MTLQRLSREILASLDVRKWKSSREVALGVTLPPETVYRRLAQLKARPGRGRTIETAIAGIIAVRLHALCESGYVEKRTRKQFAFGRCGKINEYRLRRDTKHERAKQ